MKTITVVSEYGDLTEIEIESGKVYYPQTGDATSLIKLQHDTTFYSDKQVIQANKGDYILTISKWDKNDNKRNTYAIVISDKQEVYDLDEILNKFDNVAS